MSEKVKKFLEEMVDNIDLKELLMDVPIEVERDDYMNGYRIRETTTLRELQNRVPIYDDQAHMYPEVPKGPSRSS